MLKPRTVQGSSKIILIFKVETMTISSITKETWIKSKDTRERWQIFTDHKFTRIL